MSEQQLTDQNFDQEVLKSNQPVLVDFWAPWCGPCRMLSPMINELATEYAGRAKICKLNTDENPEVASRFQISAIPALLFFKNGKLADQLTGVRPKPEIKSVLEKLF
jgi:thioredoxin 1